MKPFLTDLLAATIRALANTFVILIVVLTIALIIVGKTGDAWFLASTIGLNTVIAIFQEVRAKMALRKLELLKTETVTTLRGERKQKIPFGELRVGDHIIVKTGDQIPADGQVLTAEHFSVNQALLTGEQQEVDLEKQDLAYAGSFVVTGEATIRVTAVGTYTRAGQMTSHLKWYQNKLTPLQKSLNQVIRLLTYAAIIFGIFIYFNGISQRIDIAGIFSSIASGAISIVPEGLLLASTLLFSYGAIKLIKEQVLIQRIAAVEGFSRLDILCLDKTGTLTSNALTVEKVYPHKDTSLDQILHYLHGFIEGKTATNTTFEALKRYVGRQHHATIYESIPFSSSRKWSAILIQDGKSRRALRLGAADILLKDDLPKLVTKEAKQGKRVLALVDYGPTLDVLQPTLERPGTLLALIVLEQNIRADAEDTLFYLQAHKVKIKIISGDAPETVQAIAQRIGVLEYQKILTGEDLAGLSAVEWNHKVPKTTIFARVLPEQKERIIRTLQKQGFVGMVGDGVNDALALKQADISIAMAEGSQAARQVSDVILLKNNFAAIPIGMRLGSQIILGVEMVSCLFFNKIIANSAILVLTLLASFPYPFTTRHLLLLNIFTVGIPTVIWSLSPASASKRLSSHGLLTRTLTFTVPNGLITGLATVIAYSIGGNTAAFFVALFLGLVTFWLIPYYLHATRSGNLRRWPIIYILLALIISIAGGQFNIIKDLFEFRDLGPTNWIFIAAISLFAGLAMRALVHTKKRYVISLPKKSLI